MSDIEFKKLAKEMAGKQKELLVNPPFDYHNTTCNNYGLGFNYRN